MQQKRVVLFLGMHRSGTSAITRMTNLLGVNLGKDLMQPVAGDNELGFWEHQTIVDIHEELLAHFHSTWDDIRLLPEKWWQEKTIEPFKARLKAVLQEELHQTDCFGLKDPRLCVLLPLWKDVLHELAIPYDYIYIWRHPNEVARSLLKRNQFHSVKSHALWLLYNTQALRHSAQGGKRFFTTYDALLRSPGEVAKAMVKALNLPTQPLWQEAAKSIDQTKANQSANDESLTEALVKETHDLAPLVEQLRTILEEYTTGFAPDAARLAAFFKEVDQYFYRHQSIFALWIPEVTFLRQELTRLSDEIINQRNAKEHFQHALDVMEKAKCEIEADLHKRNRELVLFQRHIGGLRTALDAVYRSSSWRITAPLRKAMRIWRTCQHYAALPGRHLEIFVRGVKQYHQRYGARNTFKRALVRIGERLAYVVGLKKAVVIGSYHAWYKHHMTLTKHDRAAIAKHIDSWPDKPYFSIIMPVYNIAPQWLEEAIQSVQNQLYPHWELCIVDDASTNPDVRPVLERFSQDDARIKVEYRTENGHISVASNQALRMASHPYVAFLDHDDLLTEEALYCMAASIKANPQGRLWYSDRDILGTSGQYTLPYCKPDWNLDLLLGQNYIVHVLVMLKEQVLAIGGLREGFEGSQDYDLILRYVGAMKERTRNTIIHLPRILYHWRAVPGSAALDTQEKPYALIASRRAVQSFLDEHYPGAKAVDADYAAKDMGFHHIMWPIPTPAPKVSILIPTYNGVEILQNCISSIRSKTTYPNYEIVVINNRSDDQATLSFMKQQEEKGVITLLQHDKPFNFAAINNDAVQQTNGELLCLMNNDIEVISPNWLDEMVGNALRPEIGVVGAKLYYPNDTVQHGGVLLGISGLPNEDLGVAGHMFHGFKPEDTGSSCRALLAQNVSAVTAACCVVRREIYEQVGGMDEELRVAFNDVDFCIKVREAGYQNLWTPFATHYHHESITRGYEDNPEKITRFASEIAYMQKKWGTLLEDDPAYNPNLNRHWGNFTLAPRPRPYKPWIPFLSN